MATSDNDIEVKDKHYTDKKSWWMRIFIVIYVACLVIGLSGVLLFGLLDPFLAQSQQALWTPEPTTVLKTSDYDSDLTYDSQAKEYFIGGIPPT